MKVHAISAFVDNYIWVLIDETCGLFDCFDPGDYRPVLEFSQSSQLNLRTILLTHHHHDHIGGVYELMKTYPSCLVYAPDDSRIPNTTNPVKGDDTILLGQYHFKVLSNPGHTSTHISYHTAYQGWLFCGDTLFSAGCGRVFDGTTEELHQSLQLFKILPPLTQVFCAHEYTRHNLRFAQTVEPENQVIRHYAQKLNEQSGRCSLPSTIEMECSINPFLRTDAPNVIKYALEHGALSTESLDVFKVLRSQKNNFK